MKNSAESRIPITVLVVVVGITLTGNVTTYRLIVKSNTNVIFLLYVLRKRSPLLFIILINIRNRLGDTHFKM